jgi:hypothetical protein
MTAGELNIHSNPRAPARADAGLERLLLPSALIGGFMTNHSSLDPDNLPGQNTPKMPQGHDVRSLGPSDSSDTGADMAGPGLIDDDALALDRGTNEDSEGGHLRGDGTGADVGDLALGDTSDRDGTGERTSAGKEPDVRIGNDIAPDRIVGPDEAGLGSGLDEAEEAQRNI